MCLNLKIDPNEIRGEAVIRENAANLSRRQEHVGRAVLLEERINGVGVCQIELRRRSGQQVCESHMP